MLKKLTVPAFLILSTFVYAEPTECDAVLNNGFNIFQIYSEVQINEAYALMLTKTEEELDTIAKQYSSGESLSGKIKMIGAVWSSNKDNSQFREKFKMMQFRYQSGQVIDNSFYDYVKTKTVNNETLNKWESCKNKELETRVKLKDLSVQKGGFIKEIIGDESGLFTFIINKKPEQGQIDSVKIISVTKNNLEFLGSNNLKAGELIENYTGISQSMRLVNPDKTASLVVTIENFNPITHEFTKNALSHFPIGSIIASTLDFNQFSRETKNNPNGYFDTAESKWSPADGRRVMGSDYQKNYNDMLPDLRGQFLRGLNQFYSSGEPDEYENGKDEGARIQKNKYSYQNHATAVPTEGTPFKTLKTDVSDRYISDLQGGNYKSKSHENLNKVRSLPEDGWSGYVESGEGGDGSNQYGTRLHSKKGILELSQIVQGGDMETRPKNIGVYYYIRINK